MPENPAGKRLAKALREARERLGFTQAEVAEALGISRTALALWEGGKASPSALALARLAWAYGLEEEALLRGRIKPRAGEALLLGEEGHPPKVRLEIRRWLEFLEAYADFLEGQGLSLAPFSPTLTPLADTRRAPKAAWRARELLGLGEAALPGDLWTFLDGLGLPVYRAPLGEGYWGAYFRHPRLGPALLVNAETTPARQTFALAHGLAHALHHRHVGGLLCGWPKTSEEAALERFADTFAAHFLVPRAPLRREAGRAGTLTPEGILLLAGRWGVPYPLLLRRLANEGFLDEETAEAWGRLDLGEVAEALGLPQGGGEVPKGDLGRFPPSVLLAVRRGVEAGHLSPAEAAGLLDVDSTTLTRGLLAPKGAEGEGRAYKELLPATLFRSPGRPPRRG